MNLGTGETETEKAKGGGTAASRGNGDEIPRHSRSVRHGTSRLGRSSAQKSGP